MNEFLLGMLPSSLRRHIRYRSLQDLQQSLLDPLAGNIPGNRGVFRFSGDLIDFIHIDDAALGPLHIEIRGLDQAQQNIFHILAHIAGLRQGGSVCDSKGHV